MHAIIVAYRMSMSLRGSPLNLEKEEELLSTSRDVSLRGSIHGGEAGWVEQCEDDFKEKERNPFSYGG